MKTLRYIIITLLLVAALQAARAQYVIDKVCLGAQRHYRIDGVANSTYLWQLTDALNNPVTLTNPTGTSFTTTNPPTTGSEIIIQWAKPLINPGTYKLIAIQYSQAGCDTLQQGEVQVFDLPTANAGNPMTICANLTVNLADASATNYSTLLWTTSGDGVFDNPVSLHPVYTPGTNDKLSGNVTLTLTADGQGNSGSCTPAVSSLTVTISKVLAASISITADQTTVCAGATVTFTAVPVNGGSAPVYQWTVNGANVGTNSATYAYIPVNGDKVTVVMTSSETCVSGSPATSNELTIAVNNPLPASVSITADQTTVCVGATVTFTAVPVNGGSAPVYQWTVNGANVGTSSATYAYIPANGDKVTVVMTSSETCVSGSPATSNELTITVNNPLPASVSITADQTTVCAGATVTFTAVSVNGGSAPVYQWTVNGANVGTSSATYAYIPVNGDKVTAVMTSSETCVSGSPATSNELTITVNNPLPASVSITADQTTVCAGATVTFTAIPVNGGSAPVYQWTVNGANVGTSSATYAYIPANGDKVTVVMTSSETCVSGSPATSNELTIAVNNPLPASVSITADKTTVCAGATVTFTAVTVNGGSAPVYQWAVNGANVGTSSATYAYIPANGDKVTVVMTSSETCVSGSPATSNELVITVNLPIIPTFAAVAPICSGDVLAPLPITSVEGITGTWSPALNNTATTTYTFTPAAGQCATTATLTITVNPSVTATFAAVAPICSGDVLAPLPTTSVEGITGTWSPALNNTATTTYTFTPTAGQCATTATLTITVNPSVTATFAAVAPICSGDVLAPLPTTSVEGITGTWSPALNNTATTTYTFTPIAGQCATTATLTITVNPSVTATFAAVAPICSGDVLAPLPTTSVEGITGTWSPALNNTATTTYTFTPAAGQCATTATLKINVNNALPAAVTITVDQPTVCAGEIVTFTAVAVNGGSSPVYQWLVNGIPRGTNRNTYSYAPVNGDKVAVVLTSNETCAMGGPVTSNELTISVSSAPEVPIASVIQPTCSVSTGSITITAPTPATGISYTLVGTNPAVAAVTNTTGIFESLASGDYELIVENGSCVSATTRLTVNKAPLVPVAPTANVTVQPNCTFGNGTIVVTSPAEGSGYSYSIDGGISWVLSTIFIGQTPGIHSIIVKENLSGCLSAATSVTVNDLPAAPAAPTASVTVQPTCAVGTGTIVVTAPAQGSGYSYSIDGGTTWVASATFTGLVSGNYNVIVKETATGCVSAPTALTVNTAPGAPAAPTASVTIQPTCAVGTGTIVVTAPAEGSGYSYSIDGGTTWSASATFAGLVSGNYNIIVKETATGCVSAATVLTVNTAPGAPAAPTASVTVQPTCSVGTGTIVVTAPIEGSGYSYSIDGGTTWVTTATFAGLIPGNYNVIVKETATGCVSAATTLTVKTAPGAPAAPTASVTVQPTCSVGTGTIVVTTPAEGSGYSYSIDGGTTWSALATFTGLVSGNYNVIVKETATGCVSAATVLTVNTAPGAPAAPTASVTIQPNCAVATGTIVVTAPAEGSGYSYSIDGGTTWSASATFAGLVSGSYNIILKETATGCISAATALTVNAAPGTPAAPTASVTVQPTCSVGTGTIVVTTPAEGSGYSYSIDGGTTWSASATFTGLVSGNYNVIVKETVTGCVSAATALTVNTAPGAPAAPTASVTVQPTCSVGTGTIVITAPLGAGLEYSIDGTVYQSGTSFVGLAPKTYAVTVRNTTDPTCVSSATSLTVNPVPGAPAAPIIETITQPTCSTATGSVILSGLPSGNWTINPGAIAGSTTSATISGLTTGKYNFTVTDAAGCTSGLSADVTIDPTLVAPAAPTASVTVQPSCSVATGTIVITAPLGATLEYSIDGTVYQSVTSFVGLAPKTYAVTVRNTTDPTCVSAATSLTVNSAPGAPAAPTASVTVQPTCSVGTGTIVVTAPAQGSGYSYSIDGGTTWSASATFAGLVSGSYNVIVKETATSCISAATALTVNTAPGAPAAPTASVTVQPTCAVGTGTIVVTAPAEGSGYSYSIDGGTTWVTSATFTGLITGSYNIIVKETATGCISAATTLTVNTAPGAPAAPIIGTITQPTCSTATGSVVLTGLPSGNWTINPGAIAGSTTSATISGLTTGKYNFTVTDAAGCTSGLSADVTIDPAPFAPATPTASVTVQPTCLVATGTIVITAPLGAGLEYSIDGTVYQSGTTFAGLAPKTYPVTVRNTTDPTCVSAATSLTVDPVPGAPAAPIIETITQPTCSTATGSVILSGLPSGNWTINPGAIAGSTTSATISGLTTGKYNFTVTDAVGCTSGLSADVTIDPAPVAPATPTASVTVQPSCSVATGTIVITAPLGATLEYSIDGTDYQSGTSFVGLAPKTYAVTVRNTTDPTCVSAATSLTVDPVPVAPAAPIIGTITQPTCSTATGSVVLTGLPSGNWTINPGAIAGSTTSATISGLTTGKYNFTVTDAAGCTSGLSADVTIDHAPVAPATPTASVTVQPSCAVATGTIVITAPLGAGLEYSIDGTVYQSAVTFAGLAPKTYVVTARSTTDPTCVSSATSLTVNPVPGAPAAPIIGTITQPTCSTATGSVILSGLPSGNWTINPGAIAGSTTSATISGLTTGKYNFTVTDAAGCTSGLSADVTIDPAPVAPATPTASVTVQPSCAVATGTIVITAPLGAGLEYSIDGTVYQSGTTFAGLAPKTYAVIVHNSSDPTCVSAATSLTVDPVPGAPAAPIIGTITQPTCSTATGSVVLSGLPSGNWTINPGAIAGSTTSATISGLTTGKYNFTVTDAAGCTSGLSADVTIDPAPVAPATPTASVTVQPSCAVATGTIVITAPLGATLEYSIDGTVYQSGTSFVGLAPKTYAVTVRNTTDPTCVSAATSLTVNSAPGAPAAPTASVTVQPTCSVGTGTIVVTAPIEGSGYSYSIDGGTTWLASATFAGLVSGSYNVIVKETATGCISAATALTVNAAPGAPAAPTASVTVQPTCAVGTGTIVVTVPAEGSGYSYSIDGGTTWSASATFAGLVSGNYNVIVKETATGCVSAATVLTVNTAPGAPAAPIIGTITQPTCSKATGSVILSGLPSGNWTINPGAIAGSTTSATISGLTTGKYNFTVTDAAGCTSGLSADATIDPTLVAPAAPTASVTVQPSCSVATGTIVITAPLGAGLEYSIDGTVYQSGTIFAGLAPKTYAVTVRNTTDPTCVSSATSLTVNPVPGAPAAPIIGTITQPTCSTATGSVVLSGLPSGNWTINPGAIAGSTTSATISGLTTGKYNFTVTDAAGCTSGLSADVTIDPAPVAPATPTASVTVQPSCAVATGTIVITAPLGATLEYSIDGTVYQSGTSFVGLAPKTYAVTVRNTTDPTCVSAATSLTVNSAPGAPAAPTASVTVQPTCSVGTGTIVVTAPAEGSGYSYSIDGGTTWVTSATFAGLITGSYNIIVKEIATGCESAPTALTVNAAPGAPTAPTASVTVQPTCAVGTGTIVVTAPAEGSGYSYSIDGGTTWSASATFAGLVSGNYNIIVKETATGCVSAATVLTVNTAPGAPAAPTARVTVQPNCAVATGTIVVTAPAEGSGYSYSIDGGTTWVTTATFAGLITGSYNIIVKETATGCVSAATTLTVNAAPGAPAAPTASVTVQPNCAVATGTIVVTAPAEGSGYSYSIDGGTTWSASATFAGLVSGSYNIILKETATGCISAATALTVNTAPGAPAVPIVGTITQPTCSIPTGSVLLSGLPATGNWTLSRNPGGITTIGTGTSTTVAGLTAGTTYTFTVTNAAGCTSAVSASVVINTAPAIPTAPVIGTITQPTCSIPTGSVALTGLPATGTWTLTRIPGGITTTGTGTSRTISGLNSVVTYTFTVTNAAGCTSLASANVVINPVVLITPTFAAIPSLCKGDGAIVLPLSSNNSPAITGIWSPAIVTTTSPGTTRYHFQPNNNQCADTTSIAVTIRDWTSTSFSPIINSMCQNSPAPVLLTTSLNGITGTWDPAVINTAIARTTTYRFMPTAGQCATSASVEVTIIGRIMPTIDDIGPLCIGSTPPSLPLSSTNGITGTWNPATINTATPGTSTYNFNPNAGECAWVKTKDITINSKVKPDFAQIAPLCQNSAAPTLPPKSTNGFTGTWSPSTISTSLAGKTTYTFTPDPDQCATSTTMDIVINGVINPVFIQIDPLCQNSTAPLLPAVSTNGIAGTWNPSTISTLTPGTKIYTFTSNPATCPPTAAMNITVNPQVTPLFNAIGPLCQNSTPPGLPVTSTNGIAGSWSPATINTAIPTTTKYTFTPNTDQCAVPATMEIIINTPAIPQFTTIGPLCQNSAAPALPLTSTNGYTGTWNPGTISTAKSGTTSYQFTPQSGQCAIGTPIDVMINPTVTSTTNESVCNNLLPFIWNSNTYDAAGSYNIKLISQTGCDSIATLNLTLINALTPTFTQIDPILQNAVAPSLPTASLNGITGTWSPATINTTTSGTTTYTFIPDPGQCATSASMDIKIEIKAVISSEEIIPGAEGILIGACQQINLDASKSIGNNLNYQWSLLDQGGVLTNQSGINTEFQLSPEYTGKLPANFRVRLRITDQSGNKDSQEITIHIDPPPVASVFSAGKIEKDGSMIVDGTVSTGEAINFKWSTTEGKIIGPDNQPTANFFGAGWYKLEVTDIHRCIATKDFKFPIEIYQIFVNPDYARIPWTQDTTINVLDNDRSSAGFIPGQIRVIQPPTHGAAKSNTDGTITYHPSERKPGHDIFIYEACDRIGLCDSAVVTIDIYESQIVLPEGLSPNGDGINDFFVIKGLQNYKKSQLYVYTRAGQLVYQSKDYQNDWNGKTIQSTLTNLELVPTGTYYYILKLGDTNRTIKGFVYVGY